MVKFRTYSCAAALALLLVPASGMAGSMKDAAMDARGNYIHDARGNCVRTMWVAGRDVCAPAAPKQVSQVAPKAPVRRTATLNTDYQNVYFGFDSSKIKSTEEAELKKLVGLINKSDKIESMSVYGYADRIGNAKYNEKLSMKRAKAVESYLATNSSLRTEKVQLRGLGETKSVTDCKGNKVNNNLISCLSKDRRVEVELHYYD